MPSILSMFNRLKKWVLLFLLLVSLPGIMQATHIVGGELYYKYLGNDLYQIRLTVYRDCWNGVPP